MLLEGCTLRFDTIEKNLAAAMSLAVDCRKAYVFANDEVRRSLNQALIKEIWIGEHGVAGVDLQLPFAHLLANDLIERLEHEANTMNSDDDVAYRRELPVDRLQRPDGPLS